MNVNKVILVGRITTDPQIRKTPSGLSVTSFNVATNRVWTAKNGLRQQETEFHNVVVWGRQAEIACQFLTKGSLVFIEGRLRTRQWQARSGETRYNTEIICERLQLGPRTQASGGQQEDKKSSKTKDVIEEINIPEEEIPVIDIESELKEEADDLPF